jgi:uncharacterized membrane protein
MTPIKRIFLYLIALLYTAGGVNHFINPSFYFQLMPAWLPWHALLIYLSGAVEIFLGVSLIPAITRKIAAWLIIGMLIVFLILIHIPMTIDFWQTDSPLLWVSIVRLPIQIVLIWWAWIYTK